MKLNRAKISTLESITVGNCTIVLTLDTRYKAVGDKYKVAMKYTVNGTRFYFHLGDKCTTSEFDAICKADGRGRAGNKSQNYVDRCRFKDIFNNHSNIIRDLANKGLIKSIDNIKAVFNGKISSYDSDGTLRVGETFLSVWNDCIADKKASTSDTYRNARDSFLRSGVYKDKNGFAVDVNMIREWIEFMKEQNYSQTTIGMYLRACRVAFKECINRGFLREVDYPFGAFSPDKIKIPVGSSRKTEFLTVEQWTTLYNFFIDGKYPRTVKSPQLIRQSLGTLLCQYLCNGCNMYDLALLRYGDYYKMSNGKAFHFFRHKTTDHSENGSEVIAPITPPFQRILDTIAAPSKIGELVFPFLLGEGYDPDGTLARNKIHQENKNLADRMAKISTILNWDVNPTGTYARHSFATNLAQREIPIDYISFAMGHSTGNRGQITKRYISPYPLEKQMEYNSYLLDTQEMSDLHRQPAVEISNDELIKLFKDRFGNLP